MLVGVAAHDLLRRHRLHEKRPELATRRQTDWLAVVALLGVETEATGD